MAMATRMDGPGVVSLSTCPVERHERSPFIFTLVHAIYIVVVVAVPAIFAPSVAIRHAILNPTTS